MKNSHSSMPADMHQLDHRLPAFADNNVYYFQYIMLRCTKDYNACPQPIFPANHRIGNKRSAALQYILIAEFSSYKSPLRGQIQESSDVEVMRNIFQNRLLICKGKK